MHLYVVGKSRGQLSRQGEVHSVPGLACPNVHLPVLIRWSSLSHLPTCRGVHCWTVPNFQKGSFDLLNPMMDLKVSQKATLH